MPHTGSWCPLATAVNYLVRISPIVYMAFQAQPASPVGVQLDSDWKELLMNEEGPEDVSEGLAEDLDDHGERLAEGLEDHGAGLAEGLEYHGARMDKGPEDYDEGLVKELKFC
ncbi:hypothetical protein DSO57_1033032 [Entomophthora muscae]|uniref:Uncharacterized protein n=1 Tax=Entomophthora muscae TaxID=34485 RepID=A0ACC2TB45_9FUNG|nr:hypothetical protein DSO57_1033032 [Entomophthora muscae]